MGFIFICYRREDTSANAGRLHDRLTQVFGTEQVFMDVDGIQPGEDFVERIETMVTSCDAMLVVIGKHWLAAAGGSDVPRLADPQDYVRLEISTALKRKIRVIPVLVSGAQLPRSEDLPQDLVQLARRQAVEIKDASFSQDLVPLINTLQSLLGELSEPVASTAESDPRIVERPTNLSFDGAVADGFPHGWFDSFGFVSGVSRRYAVSVVSRTDRAGRCLMLRNDDAGAEEFGSVMQRFPAEFLAGRTVRLEGDLQTERVKQWAGLWLRADGTQEPDLFFDNMDGQRISGTTPWSRYSLEGHLPASTAWLNLGVVLVGRGVVRADSLRLMVWDRRGTWVDV
jgi:hypothetical protein